MALRATKMDEDAARDRTKPVALAILSPVFFSHPNRVFNGALSGPSQHPVKTSSAVYLLLRMDCRSRIASSFAAAGGVLTLPIKIARFPGSVP